MKGIKAVGLATVSQMMFVTFAEAASIVLSWGPNPTAYTNGNAYPSGVPSSIQLCATNSSGSVNAPCYMLEPTATTYTVAGPVAPGTYYYNLRYLDSSGNMSAWSNMATIVVPPPPPNVLSTINSLAATLGP